MTNEKNGVGKGSVCPTGKGEIKLEQETRARIGLLRVLMFLAGVFVSALGVALATRSDLGLSPLSLVPYVLSQKLPVTMGQLTTVVNTVFVLAQILILRKNYRLFSLLQLVIAAMYGEFVDLAMELTAWVVPGAYPVQLGLSLLSVVFTGFGVFLTVRANLVVLASEGLVCAVAQVSGQEFGKLKIALDSSMLALGVILALVLFHSPVGVREGTIISAVGVGMTVRLFQRLTDRLAAPRTVAAQAQPVVVKPHLVITIAREFGPDSVKIAHELARQLGMKLYDEELVDLAVQESGLDPEFVRRNEERMSKGLLYDLYAQSFAYAPGQQPAEDKLFLAQQRVIRRLAAQEDCIILGRSANYILGKAPGYYHVFLHAQPLWRLRKTMEEFGLGEAKARLLMSRADAQRKSRYRHYTGHAWGLAEDYNLCLDVEAYGVENCARLIGDAVRGYVYGGQEQPAPAGA